MMANVKARDDASKTQAAEEKAAAAKAAMDKKRGEEKEAAEKAAAEKSEAAAGSEGVLMQATESTLALTEEDAKTQVDDETRAPPQLSWRRL